MRLTLLLCLKSGPSGVRDRLLHYYGVSCEFVNNKKLSFLYKFVSNIEHVFFSFFISVVLITCFLCSFIPFVICLRAQEHLLFFCRRYILHSRLFRSIFLEHSRDFLIIQDIQSLVFMREGDIFGWRESAISISKYRTDAASSN